MEEKVFRLISSANTQSYPDNSAVNFVNDINPIIDDITHIGITRILFQIDFEKKDLFTNDNSFFFINTDSTLSTQIANQSVNNLNDFVLDLETITSSIISIEFTTDFFYIPIQNSDIRKIHITVTNLNGELHPLLFKTLIVDLKYTKMSNNEQTLVKLVSSANWRNYPQNNALEFTNEMIPTLENVDSVALSKISIPLHYKELPIEGNDVFTNKIILNEIKTKTLNQLDFGTLIFIVDYIDSDSKKEELSFYVNTVLNFDKSVTANRSKLCEAINDVSIHLDGWDKGSALTRGKFNIKFEKSNTNSFQFIYNIWILPGSDLEPKIRGLKFWYWLNMPDNKLPLFTDQNMDCYVEMLKPSSIVESGDFPQSIVLYDAVKFQFFPRDTFSKWRLFPLYDENYVSNDIFIIILENIFPISYGDRTEKIIQILPIENINSKPERANITIPYSNLYFLRTLDDFITNFKISIFDHNLKPHSLVDSKKTTTATLIINHGSNTELRESSYFEK